MWKVMVGDGETQYGPDYTWMDMDARHGGINKLASAGVHVPEELVLKAEELKATMPRDKVAFYNRALGSYESFGLNRNGDGFERPWLDKKHDTFVKNAHYFMHHQNKDPALSRGRPVASALNEQTDMVDLIIVADMDKCADQIQALESGKRVPTSMGARVAFDVCTVCGNRARRREEYCGHVHKLAHAPYGMRQVLDDGRMCGVMNPDPNFFDLSDVLIGAAPESETLLKVAGHAGVLSGAEMAELVGLGKLALDVEADMTKRVPGVITGSPIVSRGMSRLSAREARIPDQVIDRVRDDSGFDGVLRHTAALGMVLSPDEFSRAAKLGSFTAPSTREIWASESVPSQIMDMSLSPRSMTMLADYYNDRSSHMPALLNRIDGLRDKTASTESSGDDQRARAMYAAYRRTLLTDMDDVGGDEGRYWSMKCAGTDRRMYTDVGRRYVESAFTPCDRHDILDHLHKTAGDNRVSRHVPGHMAGEIGVVALDALALESLA